MDRPKYDNVIVTAETEVPALPSKDELVKQPNKDTYTASLAEIDEQIKDLRKVKDDFYNKKRETIEGGKM